MCVYMCVCACTHTFQPHTHFRDEETETQKNNLSPDHTVKQGCRAKISALNSLVTTALRASTLNYLADLQQKVELQLVSIT